MPNFRRTLPKRVCPYCLKKFTPNTRRQVYCKPAHRSAQWRWNRYEQRTEDIQTGLIELSVGISDDWLMEGFPF